MMQRLGRGRVAMRGCDLRIAHEILDQRLQVRVLEACNELAERPPQLIDVLGGFWQVVGKIDLRFLELAQLVYRHLEPAVVLVDQAADLDEIVLLENAHNFGDVVPYLSVDVPAAVGQRKRQVRIAALFRFHLLDRDHEAGGYDLILVLRAIADVKVLHSSSSGEWKDVSYTRNSGREHWVIRREVLGRYNSLK